MISLVPLRGFNRVFVIAVVTLQFVFQRGVNKNERTRDFYFHAQDS